MNQHPHNSAYKKQLIKFFNKAAAHYDSVSMLQQETANRMLQRLEWVTLQPQVIVDLGAGTGYCSDLLQQRYPSSMIISIDIAYEMLITDQVRNRCQNKICADAYQLPLADHSVDLVFSNMLLPWCSHLEVIFQELCRVIRPDGLLMFSSLGPDTLQELRASWSKVDNYSHINDFTDMHDVGDKLMQAHFIDPVMDSENIVVKYPRVDLILQDLKKMGSHNLTAKKRRGLMNQSCINKFIDSFADYRLDDGFYPVTCEVIYGHAWGSGLSAASTIDQAGDISIPLMQLRRRLRSL